MGDDGSSTVSLPEVPLLGVLPGTGGLTRLVDKRKVRRDLADVFCTTAEGVRADRAKAWGLIDRIAPPARFRQLVEERARVWAEGSDRLADCAGVALVSLDRVVGDGGYRYRWLDVSSRSLFAVIDHGSCFAGSLLELSLAADRGFMLAEGPRIALSGLNFAGLEMINGRTRLATRFNDEPGAAALERLAAEPLDAKAALERGLVTFAPDELDWQDEIRLAIEERASLSPDALTGMEANLRFAGPETVATKVFARLTPYQNSTFKRPTPPAEAGPRNPPGPRPP